MQTKACNKCRHHKPLDEFHRSGKAKHGRQNYCKLCMSAYNRQFKYNISDEVYRHMLKEQDYRCAICGSDEPGGRHNTFPVDHCHTTGTVRGLLCDACNLGLGKFRDDPALLRAAADYLDHHTPEAA